MRVIVFEIVTIVLLLWVGSLSMTIQNMKCISDGGSYEDVFIVDGLMHIRKCVKK